VALDEIATLMRQRDWAGAVERLVRAAATSEPARERALARFRDAVAAEPRSAELRHWHGVLLEKVGMLDEAILAFQEAHAMDPAQPGTCYCLAEALMRRAVPDEAAAAYRAVIERVGHLLNYTRFTAAAYAGLGFALMMDGEQEAAIAAFRKSVGAVPDPERHAQLVFYMQYLPGADAETILREAREWDRRYASGVAPIGSAFKGSRVPDRRLRIGYVSNDFRDHSHVNFLPPVLERHDREQVEVTCYSNVPKPDSFTAAMKASADRWRDISGLDDHKAAALVREDAIDVLVDLTMHTTRGRQLLFARRPAPVQVCWLAYPGTTGVRGMDYRVTDPHLDPPARDGDAYDRAYAEAPLRLADTFWCYRPRCPELEVGPLPARTAGHVTFGCFNNFAKVHDGVLALWAEVLRAAEGARCLLLVPSRASRRRVHEAFAARGVDPDRVEFLGRQPLRDLVAQYRRVDIALDTVPYGGHTTSLEALYMGVPVVTLVGSTIVGRAGLCFARNLGLPGLAALTPEEYVRVAVELADDLDRLEVLRNTLRATMTASPLMDEVRFVRELEQGYRTAWQRWCSSFGT
jgi:tetratricopeptide (TPR) repeat protein